MTEFHPLAEIIPPMSPQDFEALKADIRANGVRVPIVRYQGKILDGRSRYRACQELDMECPNIECGGESLSQGSIHTVAGKQLEK